MATYMKRLFNLFLGLTLYALGIVFAIQAQIGYAPWEVFHVGMSNTLGISIGTASILAGVVIGAIGIFLGEKVGIGTILNMFLIGMILDWIMILDFIPVANNFTLGLFMLILGLFTIALGSYFYIGSAFGAGPRDGLMVALTRLTKLPIGVCRGGVEIIAVIIGWKLGGMVGLGTIIAAFGIGFCVQLTFQLLHFDTTTIKHETLGQTMLLLRSRQA
jgi:uncharacterized membrane protein YczE